MFMFITVRAKNWCQSCPIRTRYLLIAAFLASNNPIESDTMKFIGSKNERRKKTRKSDDDDIGGGSSGDACNNNKTTSNSGAGVNRYFSLERLLSIYAQIAGIVNHKESIGFGSIQIYATVIILLE